MEKMLATEEGIALRAYNRQYLCAEMGGGREVVANRNEAHEWETFQLIGLDNGNVALRAHNGQYVCAEMGGGRELVANRNEIHEWETFELIGLGNGNVAFKAHNGQYVCAEMGGGREVVANRNEIHEWETFELIELKLDENLSIRVGRSLENSRDTALSEPSQECQGDYVCTVQKRQATESFDENLAIDPLSDILWPGTILDGSSIPTGGYSPITAKRGPLTISTGDLQFSDNPPYVKVDNPALSTVRAAIAQLLSRVKSATTANFKHDVKAVHSEFQLAVALNAHYRRRLVEFSGKTNFSTQSITNKVLIKFIQLYYTLDVDPPARPEDFFAEPRSIGANDMYIASVTYGRRLLFLMESTEDMTKLYNAAKAVTKKGGGEVSTEYQRIINSAKTHVWVLGGGAEDGINIITNGTEGINNYLKSGANWSATSPGKPLSYKLRFVKDNSTAYVTMASTYYERKCLKVPRKVNVIVKELRRSGPGFGREYYGTIWAQPYDNKEKELPGSERVPIWSLDPEGIHLEKQWKWYKSYQRRTLNMDYPYNRDTAFIRLEGTLWEYDRGGDKKSDELTTTPVEVYLTAVADSAQTGELKFRGRGCDVYVRYTIESAME